MRTRTLCGVLLMCVALPGAGVSAVKGRAQQRERKALGALDGASHARAIIRPAHEQLQSPTLYEPPTGSKAVAPQDSYNTISERNKLSTLGTLPTA